MPHVRKISRSVLERVRLATKSRYFVMEGGGIESLRGFGLEVGRATVQYVVRKVGHPIIRLGLVHELTPEQARELAKEELARIAASRRLPSVRVGHALTIEELAAKYRDAMSASWTSKTREEYERVWRLHLLPHYGEHPAHRKRLGDLRLPELTPDRVVVLKKDIAAKIRAEGSLRRGHPVSGEVAANRALQQLAAAFQWAIDKMLWHPGPNPASEKRVDRYRERRSRVRITPDQYPALGAALRAIEEGELLPPRTVAAIRIILRTGCRPHEILTAKLDWIQPRVILAPDFDVDTLLDAGLYARLAPRIERPHGKGDRLRSDKEGRTLWLSPADVAILRAVPRPPGCRWVIPGDRPESHLTTIQKAWQLMCRKAAEHLRSQGAQDPTIEHLTPKAARHAFRSELPAAGVEPDFGRELLGHADLRMMFEVYWHRSARAQARAAATMGDHVSRLLGDPVN